MAIAPKKEYIGDGVYAEWTGERVILMTSDGISVTNTIYLDTKQGGSPVD